MTKILVDGQEIEADPKKPLIEACKQAGFDVPTYCYHPGLTPVGSCRICQVEVKQGDLPPRVVVACRTPVVEGMVVDTEAEKAHETRRECLEFLLKNHPLDCPICDKAGECDLQDFAFNEGQASARTVEPRRKLAKRKDLGEVIVLDQERCILCSRCVRFMEEVPKSPQLTVANLGSRSVIATFMDRPLEGNYQGNLADVCPVGALTLKEFRFQARVWNLSQTPSTCPECSRGCSIDVEVLRRQDVKRLRPRENPEVNGWWMCDTGRFAFDRYNEVGRIEGALVRESGGNRPIDVDEALATAVDMLRVNAAPVVVTSPFLTLEEGEALAKLSEALGVKPRFVSPEPNGLADDVLHTGDPCPNRRGLEELGFSAASAEDCLTAAAEAKAALFVGERIGELLGTVALAALPRSLRALLFDTHPTEAPALRLSFGVPSLVERTGTYVNVDGHRGSLGVARTAPAGVRTLEGQLVSLATRLTPAEAQS